MLTEKKALNDLIDAWESLNPKKQSIDKIDGIAGGRYSPRDIEDWLRHEMAPAINAARKIFGPTETRGVSLNHC